MSDIKEYKNTEAYKKAALERWAKKKQELKQISDVLDKIHGKLENKSTSSADFGEILQDCNWPIIEKLFLLTQDKDKRISLKAISEFYKVFLTVATMTKHNIDEFSQALKHLDKDALVRLVSYRQRDQAIEALYDELDKASETS